MRTTQQMSITLPHELASMVKAKVQGGGYASESEVIREGLRALQERDAVVERWLKDDVVPTLSRHRENPSEARPIAEVMADLDAMMSADANKAR